MNPKYVKARLNVFIQQQISYLFQQQIPAIQKILLLCDIRRKILDYLAIWILFAITDPDDTSSQTCTISHQLHTVDFNV